MTVVKVEFTVAVSIFLSELFQDGGQLSPDSLTTGCGRCRAAFGSKDRHGIVMMLRRERTPALTISSLPQGLNALFT